MPVRSTPTATIPPFPEISRAGAGGLTKTGAGVLTLSGAANTFSGGLTINAGTVLDNNASAGVLGSGTVSFGANTATLDLNGNNPTVGSISSSSGNGIITNNAAGAGTSTLTFNGTTAQSFGGVIADGPTAHVALTKITANATTNSLTLGGTSANTFTGQARLVSGTLVLAKTAGLDAIGTGGIAVDSLVSAGAGNNANATVNILRLAASDQINDAADVVVNNTGNGTSNGSSTALVFDMSGGAGNFTGNVGFNETIHSLTLGNGSGSGSVVATGSGTLTVNGDVTLANNKGADNIIAIVGGGGTNVAFAIGGAAPSNVTITNAGNLAFSSGTHNFNLIGTTTSANLVHAVVSGLGANLNISTSVANSNAITFDQQNTYTGSTTITSSGTGSTIVKAIGGASANVTTLGVGGTINLVTTASASPALQLAADGLGNNSTITWGSASGTNNGQNLTISGAGAVAISVNAAASGVGNTMSFGALSLGANTVNLSTGASGYGLAFTGGATINGDSTFNNNASLTLAGGNTVNGNTTFNTTANLTLAGGTTFNGNTTFNSSGNISLTGGTAINGNTVFNASGNLTMSGGVTGSGSLTKTGSGITSIAVTPDTAVLSGQPAVSATVTSGAGLGFTGYATLDAGGHVNGVVVTNPGTYTGTVTLSIASDPGTTLTPTLTGNTNALTVLGDTSYTGPTTINSGTLQLGTGGAGTGGLGSGTITNNGILAVNRTGATTLSNNITGTGAVTQSGSGTLTLAGNNTYSGDTTVSGPLVVSNSAGSATGTGNVIINNGGSLSGNGTITPTGANTTSILSGGHLAPHTGATPNTLTINNGLQLADGAMLDFLLNTPPTDASPSFDTVNGNNSGALTISGSETVNLTGLVNQGTYRLFSGFTSVTGTYNFAVGASSNPLAGYTFTTSSGEIDLNVISPTVWTGAADYAANNSTTTGTWNTTANNWNFGAGGNKFTNNEIARFDDLTANGGNNSSGISNILVDAAGVSTTGLTVASNSLNYTIDSRPAASATSPGISGVGGLTKTGASTLTLLGTNSFTGDSIIKAGVVSVDGDAALGTGKVTLGDSTTTASASLTYAVNSPLSVSRNFGFTTFDGPSSGGGTITINNNQDATFSGQFSGTGQVTFAMGSGNTVTLTNTNNILQGSIAVPQGTLAASSLGTNPSAGASLVLGNASTAGTFSETSTASSVTLSQNVVTGSAAGSTINVPTGATNLTLAGTLSGGGLTKTGPGTLTVIGSATLTGNYFVNAGTLALPNASNPGLTTTINVASGDYPSSGSIHSRQPH